MELTKEQITILESITNKNIEHIILTYKQQKVLKKICSIMNYNLKFAKLLQYARKIIYIFVVIFSFSMGMCNITYMHFIMNKYSIIILLLSTIIAFKYLYMFLKFTNHINNHKLCNSFLLITEFAHIYYSNYLYDIIFLNIIYLTTVSYIIFIVKYCIYVEQKEIKEHEKIFYDQVKKYCI